MECDCQLHGPSRPAPWHRRRGNRRRTLRDRRPRRSGARPDARGAQGRTATRGRHPLSRAATEAAPDTAAASLSHSPRARADRLLARFREVRDFTNALCRELAPEDCVVQSMPDVSPTKWHLAHTSWFFETFILSPHASGYHAFNPHFAYLFNSYYLTVGDRHCRQNRGLLSRPTVAE